MVSGAEPSPQLTVTVCVSKAPASANEPLSVTLPVALSTLVAKANKVGAALSTTSWKLVTVVAPSLSVAVIVTSCDSAGPPWVANDHDQLPSAFFVTDPTEAVRLTASWPTSDQKPVL